jgi:trans-aconitate methyltransferase
MTRKQRQNKLPHLYYELASWFHLLTAPEDYKEEAAFYSRLLTENSLIPVKTVLELGSGGGNNASHMKSRFKLTLTDLSEEMLAVSRRINPDCEHLQGDMRNLRLARRFDAVFIHDAISYITTEKDLRATFETAFVHCKPGGSVLFCPDYITETLKETTEHGGHSAGNRGLRYLGWTWDPNASDTEYYVEMVYLLKETNKFSVFHDRHFMGIFSRDTWLKLMNEIGFEDIQVVNYPGNIKTVAATPVFISVKP